MKYTLLSASTRLWTCPLVSSAHALISFHWMLLHTCMRSLKFKAKNVNLGTHLCTLQLIELRLLCPRYFYTLCYCILVRENIQHFPVATNTFEDLFSSFHDCDVMRFDGLSICCRIWSNHCSAPVRWISIQQGVEVTSWRWYSAPQPFTKDILEGEREIMSVLFNPIKHCVLCYTAKVLKSVTF